MSSNTAICVLRKFRQTRNRQLPYLSDVLYVALAGSPVVLNVCVHGIHILLLRDLHVVVPAKREKKRGGMGGSETNAGEH